MAKLYVTEYSNVGMGNQPLAMEPPAVEQAPISFSTSTQSAAFDNATVLVRVHTDAICSIAFGTNPTATTSNRRLAADQTEYFAVHPGGGFKLAVIANT